MKVAYLLTVLLFVAEIMRAQSDVLREFSGFQQGSAIQLSFTIKGGNTCLGTDIQRSPDSIHFTTIGTIAGICGSTDKDESYTFTDEMPLFNQSNYYRLVLGQLGYSAFISVNYINHGNDLLIFPNPVTSGTMIYFPNDKKEIFEIKIFDTSGVLQSVSTTRDASISIETKNFSRGIYLVIAESEAKVSYQKKMVVQ